MKAYPYGFFGLILLASIRCEPKADTSSDQERLETACEAWCQVAIPCSVHYAGPDYGDFTTQAECEIFCASNIEEVAARRPECFDIIVDDRECAGGLSCEDFKHYENWGFGEMSKFPFECHEETRTILEQCN
jgi:hypothetical protein